VLILTTRMQNNIMACFQCISEEDIGNKMSYPLKDKMDIYIHFPKFTQPLFMEDVNFTFIFWYHVPNDDNCFVQKLWHKIKSLLF
jgi:hypothetical protein